MMRIVSRSLSITAVGLIRCPFFVFLIFGAACGQANLKEVANKDEISIKFQHIAKSGETKKYLVDINRVPKVPTLPTGYKLFENKVYLLKTETIDLGDPIVSIRIPTDSEEVFRQLRVLRPVVDDLARSGSEWRDCTMSEDNVWQVPPYTKEETGEYLPSFETRTLNCHIKDGLKSEHYFAVAVLLQPPPVKPFTDITFDYKPSEQSASVRSYDLTIKNSGQKNIGELNIYSNFNSELISIKPSQGVCKRLDQRGPGSAVCYLDGLAAGRTIAIRADVSLISPFLNGNRLSWSVHAIVKESPSDPIWPANTFSFYPFRKN